MPRKNEWKIGKLPTGDTRFDEAVRYYMTSGLDRGKLLEKPLSRRLATQRAIDEMRRGPWREISVDSRNEAKRSHYNSVSVAVVSQHLPYSEDLRDENSPMAVPDDFAAPDDVIEFQSLIGALIDRLVSGEDQRSSDLFKRMVYAIIRENNCEHLLSVSQQVESQRLLGDFVMSKGWRWGHLAETCEYATQDGCASGGYFYTKKDAFLEKAEESLNEIMAEALRGVSERRT